MTKWRYVFTDKTELEIPDNCLSNEEIHKLVESHRSVVTNELIVQMICTKGDMRDKLDLPRYEYDLDRNIYGLIITNGDEFKSSDFCFMGEVCSTVDQTDEQAITAYYITLGKSPKGGDVVSVKYSKKTYIYTGHMWDIINFKF